ncbi:MAG: DUF2283 domain-containing protein [Anaerolineae bacterium]
MKAKYDREGDILSLFFNDVKGQRNTGIELNDNVVLYFNPDTQEALCLIIIDYSKMIARTERGELKAFPLSGLSQLPPEVRATVLRILRSAPVNEFLAVEEAYSGYVRQPLLQKVQAAIS